MHLMPAGLPRAMSHVSWEMGGVLRPIFKVENPMAFPLHTQPVTQQKVMERLRGPQARGHHHALGSRQDLLKRYQLLNKSTRLKSQRNRLVAMSLLLPEAVSLFRGPDMLMGGATSNRQGLRSNGPPSKADGWESQAKPVKSPSFQ